MTRRPVRGIDVAEAAGVSTATVSKVLNGKSPRIPEATRDRVLEAAQRLGYRPDPLARSLRMGSRSTLGLIVPDIGDQYFQYVARGAEQAARERGYGIVFCNTDRDPAREVGAFEFLIDRAVDGVVLCGGGVQREAHLAAMDWEAMRVVSVGPHQLDTPNLAVDNRAAMRDAITHLADRGRRRVLCLAGGEDWLVTRARLEGVRLAVEELDLDHDSTLVRYAGFTAAEGADAMAAALDDGTAFDAVLAFNDYAAVGAMSVLTAAGRGVPDDVAVVGCDDTDIAAYARVPLTTISFPAAEIGAAAVQVLCDGAQFPEPFGHRLVIRESTADQRATST